MQHPPPDKSTQKLCRAIAAGIISVVKDLCQKRLKKSTDKTLGYFHVDTRPNCLCLGIPNKVYYEYADFMPDSYNFLTWPCFDNFIPQRLFHIICTGKCKCLIERQNCYHINRKISPLAVACYYGHTQIVRYLVKVDRTAVNSNDYIAPLMMTVLCQNRSSGVRIAKILIKAGADIDVVDALSRFHVLELAAFQKNSKLIKYILQRGANVNSLRTSPLLLAREDKKCRRALLNGGAQVLNQDLFRCPLHHALMLGSSGSCIRDYLESPSFRYEHKYLDFDVTWMQLCLVKKSCMPEKTCISMLRRLLDFGLPIDSYLPSRPTANWTMESVETEVSNAFCLMHQILELGPATFLAVRNHRPKVLEYLLRRGAQVNFTNVYGMTAIMVFAFSSGYPSFSNEKYREILSILCNYGIDLNARDVWGRTAVFYAAAAVWIDGFVLKLLLEKNINCFATAGVDGQLSEKRSVFYLACTQRSHCEKAEALLEYGYNIRKETWLMQEKLIPEHLKGRHAVKLQAYLSLFRNTDTLQSMCRREIRNLLGINVTTSVKHLGLPDILQDYVMVK